MIGGYTGGWKESSAPAAGLGKLAGSALPSGENMRSIRTWLPALLAASSLFAGVAAAQTYDHSVYLDIDNNAATGWNSEKPGMSRPVG